MGGFEVGVILLTGQTGEPRVTQRWSDLLGMARLSEELGFDTVWVPDELLWRPAGKSQMGMWDGPSMAAALAASTSRIKIGTWVVSALHRNPGITAKIAETIDEISGGRFVFGLGAGHAGPGQATAFGLPEDHIFGRFEEALEIIVPLLRNGHAEFEGRYHAARDLDEVPQGPRPNGIPLMLGVLGEKGFRLAARHADIWSSYATERIDMVEFGPRLAAFEAACVEVGRDPKTIGRSAGVDIRPAQGQPDPDSKTIAGPVGQMAEAILALRDGGFDHVELWPDPFERSTIEALGPVLEQVRAG